MEIRHIHPAYASREEREERLRELCRACLPPEGAAEKRGGRA